MFSPNYFFHQFFRKFSLTLVPVLIIQFLKNDMRVTAFFGFACIVLAALCIVGLLICDERFCGIDNRLHESCSIDALTKEKDENAEEI